MLYEIPIENVEDTGKNVSLYVIIFNLKFIFFLYKLMEWILLLENKNESYLETFGFITFKTVQKLVCVCVCISSSKN